MRAYAKINLALEVMETVDGYHMVNNIMVPIDLYDEITLEKDEEISSDSGIENDITVRAAREFFSYYKMTAGVRIHVKKNIPQAGGLAGGSTDAAAVLNGLCELYNVKRNDKELEYIASLLGSDIPFFINGRPALCTHRGEIVNPLESALKMDVLIINPGVPLSTKEVYAHYVYDGNSRKEKNDAILRGMAQGDVALVRKNIYNDLERTSLSISGELRSLYEKMKEKGIDVHVSGSGPSMFVISPTKEETDFIKSLNPSYLIMTKAL